MAVPAFSGKNEKTDSPYKKYTSRFSLKFYIPLVIVIVALLFGLKFMLNDRSGSYISVTSDSAGRTCVSIDGKTVKKDISGGLSGEPQKNFGEDVCAFLLYVKNGGSPYYSLNVVKNGRFRTVSESSSSDYMLSADGNGLAFADTDGKLCVCDTATGKITVVSQTVDKYTLSPDGRTVVYSRYDDAGLSYVLYMWTKNTTTELGTGLLPCAVGDGGENIYAFSVDMTSFYTVSPDGNSKEKLSSDCNGCVYFNRDMTQTLFRDGENTYICTPGHQRKMIFEKESVQPVFSSDTVIRRVCTSSEAYAAKTDSLLGTVYSGNDSDVVCFVDDGSGKTLLRSDSLKTTVSDNGRYVFILSENGTLFRYNADKKAVTLQIADGVNEFAVSSNGKKTAYTTSDGSLMMYDGRKAFKLDGGVNTIYFTDKNCIFYLKSDNKNVLMCSENGKLPTEISTEAYAVTVSDNGKAVFYYAPSEKDKGKFDRFASDGSAKFRKIMSDAELLIK